MKLIATDMDGTLLNKHNEISEENVRAIQKAKEHGIEVVVATGRAYESALDRLQAAGLQCPVICLNGAEIRSEEGAIVKSIPLNNETYKKIQRICQREDLYFEVFTNQGTYAVDRERSIQVMVDIIATANPHFEEAEARKYAEERLVLENFSFIESYEELLSMEGLKIYKVLAFSFDEEQLNYIRGQLKGEPELAITSSARDNLEFNHKDAQKGLALKAFAEQRGIKMEDVMALGDNFNDASMLQMAGRGVAMGNAEEEIKKLCRYVTKTNNDHGVAYAIEEMLQEKIGI
ncbi:MAG: Cof-type HAD-IIB family hydrolase [Ectobacillus sp.]